MPCVPTCAASTCDPQSGVSYRTKIDGAGGDHGEGYRQAEKMLGQHQMGSNLPFWPSHTICQVLPPFLLTALAKISSISCSCHWILYNAIQSAANGQAIRRTEPA